MPYRPDRRAVHSSIDLVQRRALVHGDVLGLVAFDLILRLIFARVAWMSLLLGVAGVDLDDPAAHMPGLRVPTDVIADFELRAHALSPPSRQGSMLRLPGCKRCAETGDRPDF